MNKNFIVASLIIVWLIGSKPTVAQNIPDAQTLALEYFRLLQYDKAAAIFEQLYDKNPNATNYFYYFTCLLELKDFRKAERIVRQQIRTNPGTQRYNVDLGYVFLSSGDTERGLKEYENVIRNLTANRGIIAEVANAFLTRRENDLAIKTYLKGKELLGGSYSFSLELGDLFDRNGSFEQSLNEYLNYLQSEPGGLSIVQSRLQYSFLSDTDNRKSDMLRQALLRRIRQTPDATIYPELMLWLSLQKQDFESALSQAIALDRRLSENGNRVNNIGQLAFANQQYQTALRAFNYLVGLGQSSPLFVIGKIEIINTEYYILTTNPQAPISDLKLLEQKCLQAIEELGKTRQTLALIRNLAHLQAFYLFSSEDATKLLTETLSLPGINVREQADIKLELADILLYADEVWDASLLYSQVEKSFPNDPVGHEAKFRNARLSYFIGEFEWAKAQLDVLKAATSKLIANDAMALSLLIQDNMDPDSTYTALSYYARAELDMYRNRIDFALQTYDSILSLFPYHSIHDEVLFQKAELFIRKANYTDAAASLQKILDNFGYEHMADKAMFKLGEVYERYPGHREKAMEVYKELLLQHPGSLYAAPARERYRLLRGDAI